MLPSFAIRDKHGQTRVFVGPTRYRDVSRSRGTRRRRLRDISKGLFLAGKGLPTRACFPSLASLSTSLSVMAPSSTPTASIKSASKDAAKPEVDPHSESPADDSHGSRRDWMFWCIILSLAIPTLLTAVELVSRRFLHI